MKRKIVCLIMVSLLVLISSIPCIPVNANDNSKQEDTLEYIANAPDWSDEEYLRYYKENNMFIASPSPEVTNKITDVGSYLSERFPEYSWTDPSDDGRCFVGDVYRGNPDDISEQDQYMQNAKAAAGITYTYIGCGAIALCSQLFYLAEHAGYTFLNEQTSGSIDPSVQESIIISNREKIATKALEKSKGMAAEDWGLDPGLGTFIMPTKIKSAANSVLSEYYDGQISVDGDLIPSIQSLSTKIKNIENSIDKGMPVIIWTTSAAGKTFGKHYFNIFGYENWVGTGLDGETITHTVFKVNLNTGVCYMDSDLIGAVDCGLFFFTEHNDREFYRPSDYNLPLGYNNSEAVSSVGSATITRLRAAYVDHYNSSNTDVDAKYISLSSRKQNAGLAYMNYEYNRNVKHVNMELSWWGSSEGVNSTNGQVRIDYIGADGTTMSYNLFQIDPALSKDPNHPSKLKFSFPSGVKEFRIVVQSNYATGTYNRGRIVVGNVDVVFE